MRGFSAEKPTPVCKGLTIFLMSTLNATVLVGAMNTGIMTVGLPRITTDLQMSSYLIFWCVPHESVDSRSRLI